MDIRAHESEPGPAPPAPPRFLDWVTRLVHTHRARLCRLAQREGLREQEAFDCVQEAFHGFLVLPQARLLVDEPEDSAKILSVLTRNLARNRRRRHDLARQHRTEPEVLESLREPLPAPDALIAEAEAHVLLLGCVATLGEVQRAVVTLRMLDEVPGEDVARMLGTTPGNVAVLLHRAKTKLRGCLMGAGFGGTKN